jgi:microcompartment protein CcmK/EutM
VRLGIVRGRVVLSVAAPGLPGGALLVVEPVTAENLSARNGEGGGRPLIVADHLGGGDGDLVGIVEGSEAANAYHPGLVPVDAYCALIVRDYEFRPAGEAGTERPTEAGTAAGPTDEGQR